MSADNGWSEYSKLVLKELSSLATNIESLNNEIQELVVQFLMGTALALSKYLE